MRVSKPGERKVRLIARSQSLDSQALIFMLDEPPKERPADAASGHGHVHCAGRAPVDAHDGRRYVPAGAQSRGSFQPIAGNQFNEIVTPLLATADAEADDFVLPGQTNRDRHALPQGGHVGSFPPRQDRGGSPGRNYEEKREGTAKYSPTPRAPLLRCHRFSAPKTRSPLTDDWLCAHSHPTQWRRGPVVSHLSDWGGSSSRSAAFTRSAFL